MPFAELHVPDGPSLVFLVWVFFFLPSAAIKSARRMREADPGKPGKALPSRSVIWISTIVSLSLMFALAWWAGSGFGFRIFALPELGVREVLAALAALLVCFAIRAVLRASRTEAERRKLAVYKLAPRTRQERFLWNVTIVAAGIAEEAAYRGVAMAILVELLGNAWIAVLLCALAFAIAHWMQGWKSGLAIFAIALTMHALVGFTHTLVLAMIVHALYDFAAGIWIRRQMQEDALENPRSDPSRVETV